MHASRRQLTTYTHAHIVSSVIAQHNVLMCAHCTQYRPVLKNKLHTNADSLRPITTWVLVDQHDAPVFFKKMALTSATSRTLSRLRFSRTTTTNDESPRHCFNISNSLISMPSLSNMDAQSSSSSSRRTLCACRADN